MHNVFSPVAGIMDDLRCFCLLHEDASLVQREIDITFGGYLEESSTGSPLLPHF